jgi:hypothetical protein
MKRRAAVKRRVKKALPSLINAGEAYFQANLLTKNYLGTRATFALKTYQNHEQVNQAIRIGG